MKIAILASEGAPYCKSGGLGDVMEALPAALQRIEGNEVVLVLPYYKKIKDAAEKFPVEKDAEIEDCIIMNDTVIGEGAKLKYVILDKNVTVSAGTKLYGTKKAPVYIKRGDSV